MERVSYQQGRQKERGTTMERRHRGRGNNRVARHFVVFSETLVLCSLFSLKVFEARLVPLLTKRVD